MTTVTKSQSLPAAVNSSADVNPTPPGELTEAETRLLSAIAALPRKGGTVNPALTELDVAEATYLKARTLLADLEAEAERLPGRLKAATAEGDVDGILATRRALDELSAKLERARLDQAAAALAHYQAVFEAAEQAVPAAHPALASAETAMNQATANYQDALATYQGTCSQRTFAWHDLLAAKAHLARLTNEATRQAVSSALRRLLP